MTTETILSEGRLPMTRLLNARRRLVYDAWKDPPQVKMWWGCHGTTHVDSTIDFLVGGSFCHRMHDAGQGTMACRGVYIEIIDGERIA